MKIAITFLALVGALAALSFFTTQRDQKERDRKRRWRIKVRGGGEYAYEEMKGDAWVGFTMHEITDYREWPHHLRILCSARWTEYPEWTHTRRDEILARIRSELQEPMYVLKEA